MRDEKNPGTEILPRWRWLLAACVFASVLAAMACFQHTRDWNSTTRLLLTQAIVNHGSIEISRYVSINGQILFTPPTRDLARTADGRFYCDKPPGHSILGAPVNGLLRLFGSTADDWDDPSVERFDYWTTLGTSGIATAATAALLVLILARLGARPIAASAAALAFPFATFAQAYGTLYYGHASAALWILAGIAVLLPNFDSIWRNTLSGFLAGLAIATEYPTALFFFSVLLVHAARRIARLRGPTIFAPIAFAAGSLPPLVALGYYHFLITGSPFEVPYTLEANPDFAYHKAGMGIPISLPDPSAIGGLLIGPTRGLIWYAPVLLAAIPGCIILIRRGYSAATSVILLTSLMFFLAIAGFPAWHGGVATGPRLILASIPPLLIPVGVWLDAPGRLSWARPVWMAVAVIGTVWITLINAAGARVPHMLTNVTRDYIEQNLSQGLPVNCHVGQWITGNQGGILPAAVTLAALTVLALLPLLFAWRLQTHIEPPADANGSFSL